MRIKIGELLEIESLCLSSRSRKRHVEFGKGRVNVTKRWVDRVDGGGEDDTDDGPFEVPRRE